MEEYIKSLLAGVETWRVELFISKMKDLADDAVINEVGSFANTAKNIAAKLLQERH